MSDPSAEIEQSLASMRRTAAEARADGYDEVAQQIEEHIRIVEVERARLGALRDDLDRADREIESAQDMGRRTGQAIGTGMATGCFRTFASMLLLLAVTALFRQRRRIS